MKTAVILSFLLSCFIAGAQEKDSLTVFDKWEQQIIAGIDYADTMRWDSYNREWRSSVIQNDVEIPFPAFVKSYIQPYGVGDSLWVMTYSQLNTDPLRFNLLIAAFDSGKVNFTYYYLFGGHYHTEKQLKISDPSKITEVEKEFTSLLHLIATDSYQRSSTFSKLYADGTILITRY